MKHRKCAKNRGFSLIEASIGLLIAGLLVAPAINKYAVEIRKSDSEITSANLFTVKSAIGSYYTAYQEYPLPARAEASFDDSDFGEAVSKTFVDSISIGSCNEGVCRVSGLSDSDGDKIGDTVTEVIFGAVPFKNISIPSRKSMDAWNNKILYVVTRPMTDEATFDEKDAAIGLADSSGSVITQANAGFPHIYIGSYGPNGVGAYSISGKIGVACDMSSPDYETCNVDYIFGAGISDDYYTTITEAPVGFWTYQNPLDDTDDNMYNTNDGRVGIGTDQPSDIDIDGDGSVESDVILDVAGSIRAEKVGADKYCSHSGDCFNPSRIAKKNPSGTHGGYIDCTKGAMVSIINDVYGINETCETDTQLPECYCGSTIVMGLDSSGNCICGGP